MKPTTTKHRQSKQLPVSPVSSSFFKSIWIVCGLLAVLTFVLYRPVLEFDFVNYDDPDYVSSNSIVQQGLTPEGVRWAFTSAHSFNWHPMTWLSHMVDCQLFGANPGRHHLVNVIFHIANACLLLWVLAISTRKLWPSAFVAGIFAVHPLHVESVAWVCERKDVLSTFFWLLTMLAYVGYAQSRRAITGARRQPSGARSALYYGLALTSFALGLMSKPMLVTLPFALLLFDYWPLKRVSRDDVQIGFKVVMARYKPLIVEKLPFFALTVASSCITFLVQRSEGAVADVTTFPLGLRIGNAFVAYLRYLGKTFCPQDLIVFYPYPENWPVGLIAVACVVIVCLSVVACRFAQRMPFAFVGWFWFVGTLVPVVGIVQVGLQSMADRYMYVPLIGLSIAITWSVLELFKPRIAVKTVTVAAVGILAVIGYTIVAHSQIKHWKNSETLFGHALAVSPDNVMARVMLGNARADSGNVAGAMEQFQEVLRRRPDFAEVHYNLANLYAHQNQLENAIQHYEKTVQLRPDYLDARANYASVLGMSRRFDEAFVQYQLVLQQRPDDPLLLRNYSVDLMSVGKLTEAGDLIAKAMQLTPNEPVLYMISGDILVRQGNRSQAITRYTEALRLQPDFPDARQKLERLASSDAN